MYLSYRTVRTYRSGTKLLYRTNLTFMISVQEAEESLHGGGQGRRHQRHSGMHADTALRSGSGAFDVNANQSAVRDSNGIAMLLVALIQRGVLGKNAERSLARRHFDHFDEHYAD